MIHKPKKDVMQLEKRYKALYGSESATNAVNFINREVDKMANIEMAKLRLQSCPNVEYSRGSLNALLSIREITAKIKSEYEDLIKEESDGR